MKSIYWICHFLCICSIVFVIKAFKLSYICQHCSIWNTDSFFCAFPSIHFFNINKNHHTLLLHAWSFIMNIDQAFHSISAKKMSSMLKNPRVLVYVSLACQQQFRLWLAFSRLLTFLFTPVCFVKGSWFMSVKFASKKTSFKILVNTYVGFECESAFLFWRRTSVFTL